MTDIIDTLSGIVPGSKGEALRARRPMTKEGAQASWQALFAPSDDSQISIEERFAVAVFVAALHGQPEIAAFYAEKLAANPALLTAVQTATSKGTAIGPYGHYPAGPLSSENTEGPVFTVADSEKAILGARLSAALEHAHLLIFHLRDAKPQALDALLKAGWSTTGIVTLSQLISFLAFQIRVVAGLKVLNAA
ncbi:CMD domain protein [Agrobacterium vitis]|uniref:CMD domain protein n=1 Tax=Agrobacterium vitis TaxID=373 RepID=UPI0012E740F5|nr:CMD domain protein [Agrobacterium vitis]MVA82300.1 CMD domain protein [Agrobacterium vitis]